jgi:hypothetical protein
MQLPPFSIAAGLLVITASTFAADPSSSALLHEAGTGTNRIEIYLIRGATSERRMMVYFPEHHLLYGSDPFQKRADGSFFYPQTVTELMDAVTREKLDVDTFFMMHIGMTPWSDLAKAVQAATAQDTPHGAPWAPS